MSPEMPYFHSSGWPRRLPGPRRRRAAAGRRRAAGRRAAGTGWCRRRSGRSGAARSGCACRPAPAPARRRGGRGTSRPADGASASESAKPVMNASRAVPPGGSRTNWRSDTIGSSTGPVVFDSGSSVASASGLAERAAAADEARAVGLVLRRRADPPASAQHVQQVGAVAADARTPRADQRVALGQRRGLDEQVRERRDARGRRRRARARPPRSW